MLIVDERAGLRKASKPVKRYPRSFQVIKSVASLFDEGEKMRGPVPFAAPAEPHGVGPHIAPRLGGRLFLFDLALYLKLSARIHPAEHADSGYDWDVEHCGHTADCRRPCRHIEQHAAVFCF